MNESRSISNHGSGRSPTEATTAAPAPLPKYLSHLVRHYHDDFYISRSFETQLIVQLMAEGFLPIATRGYLLPKLHIERCVLQLNPQSRLHISRSTRKKSKSFLLSVNKCFDGVVAGCHRQHGTNWLYPPIVAAFREIHQKSNDAKSSGMRAMIMTDDDPPRPHDITSVRLYSVEVWNASTSKLVGGELGYSVGAIYSSLTGFSDEDAAGSVQLVALGKLLTKCGFEYWDLGMELEYKRRLGAELMGRSDFLTEVKRSRIENREVVLQSHGGSKKNAKELVDWEQPRSVANEAIQNNGSSTALYEENTISNEVVNSESNRKRPHDEEKKC